MACDFGGGKFCPLIGKISLALFFDAQARGSEILPGKDLICALSSFRKRRCDMKPKVWFVTAAPLIISQGVRY